MLFRWEKARHSLSSLLLFLLLKMSEQYLWGRPSFFKVMIGPDFPKTLRVPPHFKKHLGTSPREKAVLRRPGSWKWEVKIESVGGDLYFQQGWGDFVADNSITSGEFLVFFYGGDYGFDVVVYGTSGCEKENFLLPLREVKVEPGSVVGEVRDQEKVLAVAIEKGGREDDSPAVWRKRKASLPLVGRKKRKGTEWKKNKLCFKVIKAMKRMKDEDEKVLKAACTSKATHPHFVVICRPSRSTFMPIPAELDRLYNLAEKDLIIVRDPYGRSWPIKVSSWRDGRRWLASGWSLAYKNNRLREGDACLLEFVQGGNEINLHIFRVKEYMVKSDSERRLLPNSGKERVLKQANSFKTKHPNFVVVRSRSLLYHVNIPQKVVKELDMNTRSQQAVLLDPNGRSWPVQITCRSCGQLALGIGWSRFVKGNGLDIGDACLFEFVRGAEEIQVHIFPVREPSTSTAITTLEQSPHLKSETVTG